MRIGPRMQQVETYVAMYPAEYAVNAARYAGPHGSVQYGYRSVWRAVKAGLVRAEVEMRGTQRRYRLYPVEASNA